MMARVFTKFFVILILSAVALADKAPGYDPQPLASAQGGYKVAQEAPKPGPAPAPLGPSYTSFEYNTVNQGKDLNGGFSGSNFGPSAFSASSSSGANAGGYGPPDTSVSLVSFVFYTCHTSENSGKIFETGCIKTDLTCF